MQNVGKLKSIGAKHPWSIPLILPVDYRDFRFAFSHFEQSQLNSDSPILFHLNKVSNLSDTSWVGSGKKKSPMQSMNVSDANGMQARVVFFGDNRDLSVIIQSSEKIYIYGNLEMYNNNLSIKNPELISHSEVGKVTPVYPGKPKVITPRTVKERVVESLENVDNTVIQLRQLLGLRSMTEQKELFKSLDLKSESLKGLILKCHFPGTPEEGFEAQRSLALIATKFALSVASSNRDDRVRPELAIPVNPSILNKVLTGLPFTLTDEQLESIQGMLKSISEPRLSLSTLSGDVGTGKTAVYGSVSACCAYAGAKIAILTPNTVLCEQVFNELNEYWPNIPMEKAWGVESITNTEASIYVGTTALIHQSKKLGMEFNLVIVDEEHRFSREQKEDLMGAGSNYIGSTATLIPRTLQLVAMGAFDVYRITKCHIKKIIHTHISNELDEVHKYVNATLKSGYQVLIVMPIAQGESKEKETSEEAFQYWNSFYPGRVGLAHGKMKDNEKIGAINAMKDGQLDILVSTTVIEVGITIKAARTMVIYHPEVLGLATLHQLRGRLGRSGDGQSHLLLYLPKDVKDKTMQRLLALQKESDGFKLANADLKMRGFGDLAPNAEKQTGGMPSLLPGYEITVEDVEEIERRQLLYKEQNQISA